MKRRFEREFEQDDFFQIIEKKKIGVFGIGRSVGTTFVSTSIVKIIAQYKEKAVAFIELSHGEKSESRVYNILGIDKRFEHRKYNDLHEMVKKGKYIRDIRNMDSGINWAVILPKMELKRLNYLQESRLINNISGDYIICDFGNDSSEERIIDMDVLICVVDSKPSKLIGSRNIYQKFKQEEQNGKKIIWVLNKVNGGINKKSFNDYMKIKKAIEIPMIKEVHFYNAEYNCRLPIEQKEIKIQLTEKIEDIVKEIIL